MAYHEYKNKPGGYYRGRNRLTGEYYTYHPKGCKVEAKGCLKITLSILGAAIVILLLVATCT